jgi:hypothetical protein
MRVRPDFPAVPPCYSPPRLVSMPSTNKAVSVARHVRLLSWIALLGMLPVVFYFTTEGTWRLDRIRRDGGYSGHFFAAQARSLTHRKLRVERSDIQSECWVRDSSCYGYFGLTPSLIRLPLLGALPPLTPFYLGTAILLGYWAALRLVARAVAEFTHPHVTHRARLGYFIIAALALGPGGTLLFLTRPAVYEEAAAWCVAFFLMAVERVWAWSRTHEVRPLVLATLFAIAAANARPTAVSACAVLGLLVAVLSLASADPAAGGGRRPRVLLVAACLGLLPFLTSAGVFWLKFKTPFPDLRLNEQVPEAPFWRDILETNGDKTRGLMFLPTELVAYLRPDGVVWRETWPHADFAFPNEKGILWLPPLPQGGAYAEPFATVTSTMPLALALGLFVVLWLGAAAWRRARAAGPRMQLDRPTVPLREWILAAGLLASAAAMALLTVTTVGIANRYLSDFFPALVVGMALGPRSILPILGRRPILGAIATGAAVLLTAWSVVVTVLLTVRLVFV